MSLLPYIVDDFYPTSYNNFGSRYYPSNFYIVPAERSSMRSLSGLKSQLSYLDDLEKKSHVGKEGFQICLDVQHFQPNEISVKTENNSIFVHGKHEEKQDDHGCISREFTRRYELPKGFKVDDLTSSLSSDGILTLKCPHAPSLEGSNVRQIQIQQTGPARFNVNGNDLEQKIEQAPKSK